MMNVGVHVSRDKKVQVAVAVVVSPGRANAEAAAGDSRFLSDIFELAVPRVLVEDVVAITCDIDIGQTIIVEVAYRQPHAPTLRGQPRGLCDIGKVQTSALAIERDHRIAAMQEVIDR